MSTVHLLKHLASVNYSSAIAKNPIEGVYVTPSSSNPLGNQSALVIKIIYGCIVWFGVLIVRCGVFSGGIFRFVLTIPDDFPENTEVPVGFDNQPH